MTENRIFSAARPWWVGMTWQNGQSSVTASRNANHDGEPAYDSSPCWMAAHWSRLIAPVPESVSRSIRTSSAWSANRFRPASSIASARSSRVVIRIGSTAWIRNGSMIVRKGSIDGSLAGRPERPPTLVAAQAVASRVVVPSRHVPKHQDPASGRKGRNHRRTGGRRPPVRPQDQRLPDAVGPQRRRVRGGDRRDRALVGASARGARRRRSRRGRTAGPRAGRAPAGGQRIAGRIARRLTASVIGVASPSTGPGARRLSCGRGDSDGGRDRALARLRRPTPPSRWRVRARSRTSGRAARSWRSYCGYLARRAPRRLLGAPAVPSSPGLEQRRRPSQRSQPSRDQSSSHASTRTVTRGSRRCRGRGPGRGRRRRPSASRRAASRAMAGSGRRRSRSGRVAAGRPGAIVDEDGPPRGDRKHAPGRSQDRVDAPSRAYDAAMRDVRLPPVRHISSRRIVAVRGESLEVRDDRVVGEAPLEIRAAGPHQDPVAVAVTMRTPGHEAELAVGFLRSEGLIRGDETIATSGGDPAHAQPARRHDRRPPVASRSTTRWSPQRHFVATASCGICGKASIDEVAVRCDPIPAGPVVPAGGHPRPARPDARRPARVRRDRRPACGRAVHPARRARRHPRGRRPPQRARQGHRVAGAGRRPAAPPADPDGLRAGSASRSSRRRPSPGSRSSARCRRRPTWRSRPPSASA